MISRPLDWRDARASHSSHLSRIAHGATPGSWSRRLSVAALLAAVALSANAYATPSHLRSCGFGESQESQTVSATRNVTCRLAHRVDHVLHTRPDVCGASFTGPCRRIFGFRCRIRRHYPEGVTIRCARGGNRVVVISSQ